MTADPNLGIHTVVIDETPTTANQVGGRINMATEVVATIAGLAAKQVDGIHALGRWEFLSFAGKSRRGVNAEVGQKQAAFDLDVILDYGVDIRQVVAELRRLLHRDVAQMAGREVVEVNIHVVGLHLPDADKPTRPKVTPRVE